MAHRISEVSVLAFLAAIALPSFAFAQTGNCDSPEHQRGRELRQQHQDEQAFELFRGIYEREHSACAQARMGLALRALGRWVDAESALSGALAQRTDPWVTGARAQLEQELNEVRQHVGELEVLPRPQVDGAELWIDGQRAATLPLSAPLRVASGQVILEVRAPGHRTVQRTITVESGQLTRETVPLVRALSESATETPAGGAGSASGALTVGTGAGPAADRPPQRSMLYPAIAFGGAGAAVITGAILLGVAEGRYNAYRDCATATAGSESVCPETRAEASDLRRASIVAFGIGAAAAVAGAVLLFIGPTTAAPSSSRASVSFSCSPTLANAGVACMGHF